MRGAARRLRALAAPAMLLLALSAPAAVAMRALSQPSAVRRDAAARAPGLAPPGGARGRAAVSARGEHGLVVDAGTPGSTVRITFAGIKPGDSRRAPLRVRNATRRPLTLHLRTANVRDQPRGIYGGRLSSRLAFRIFDRAGRLVGGEATTHRRARVTVLHPRQQRWFFLRMRFVDGGPSGPTTGDNAVQGAGARVDLVLEGEG